MAFLNKVNALVGTGLFQDFHRIVERAKFDSISFRENFSSVLVGKVFASTINLKIMKKGFEIRN